jgi:hypothetical protein
MKMNEILKRCVFLRFFENERFVFFVFFVLTSKFRPKNIEKIKTERLKMKKQHRKNIFTSKNDLKKMISGLEKSKIVIFRRFFSGKRRKICDLWAYFCAHFEKKITFSSTKTVRIEKLIEKK